MLTPEQQDARFIDIFKTLNKQLLEFGWMLSGLMVNYEVEALRSLLANYLAEAREDDKAKLLDELNNLMTRHIFAPNVRAYSIFRLKKEPTTHRIAHHIEAGTLHYYKADYLSCVLTILPALEGLLLARCGWSAESGTRKPSYGSAIAKLASAAPQVSFSPKRFEMHREALVAYMQKWIFQDHLNLDTGISYLSRHYALHCMGTGCYYTTADCHRLFTFLDVFLDFIGYETGRGINAFIPDDEPFINRRVNHYKSLLFGQVTLSAMQQYELNLMKEHSAFVPEATPLDWTRIAAESARDFQEAITRIRADNPPH